MRTRYNPAPAVRQEVAGHFWGRVEPLGDLGAKPRGRGVAAKKSGKVLILCSYPQAKPFIKDLLSFLYKSFLVYRVAVTHGWRGLQRLKEERLSRGKLYRRRDCHACRDSKEERLSR